MKSLIVMLLKLKMIANKIQIKNAVESAYGVSVKAVNTMKQVVVKEK